jgi:transcriptional regulator with XRE-family HTH domain
MKTWDDFEKIVKDGLSEEEYNKHILASKISAKIIELRLDNGLTQQELADLSGLKQSAIARIESNGALPRLDTLLKILRALNAGITILPNTDEVVEIKSLVKSTSISAKLDEVNILWEDEKSKNVKDMEWTNAFKEWSIFFHSGPKSYQGELVNSEMFKRNFNNANEKDLDVYYVSDLIEERGVEKQWDLRSYVPGLMN